MLSRLLSPFIKFTPASPAVALAKAGHPRKHPRRKRLFLVLISLILVISILIYRVLNVQTVEAVWFDDNYTYREKISITNSSSLVSDQTASVTYNTSSPITNGQMQADCDDIRFTDINGKLLPFTIGGTGCNQTDTTLTVAVPTIHGTPNKTEIYIYYGNPQVSADASSSLSQSACSTCSTANSGTVDKGPSPLLFWKFDEGYGTTAEDTSSYNNDGTLTGATVQSEDSCFLGKCLKFDGSNDYTRKTYSSDSELDVGTASFTVSAWFKHPSSISGTDVLIARSNNAINGIGYKVYMNSSGYMCFGIDEDATSFPADSACTTTSLADSKWHFVEAVKNTTSNIQIYIDGQLITQTSVSTGGDGSLSGTSPNFVVGNDGDSGTTNPWDGFIDEVKVYNFAKSANQVKTDFENKGSLDQVGAALGLASPAEALSEGLVGWWKMDDAGVDAEGETSTDSSGNGNTGTLYGDNGVGDNGTGMDCTASGKFGTGCDFDGTDDYISVANNSSLNITNHLTLEAWVRLDSLPVNWGSVIEKADRSQSPEQVAYWLGYNSSGYLFFWAKNSSGTWIQFTDDQHTLSLSQWHHVVVTYVNDTVNIYIDGTLSDTGSLGLNPLLSTNGTFSIAMGYTSGDTTPTDYELDGKIDDIRIYNRALSPAEVRTLYNWAPGPVAYWNFDENTGTGASAVKDRSGNANHGTMEASMTESDWVPGKFGSALDFDGTDDSVNAGSDTSIDNLTTMTAQAWIYPTGWGGGGFGRIFQKDAATDVDVRNFYLNSVNTTGLSFAHGWSTSTSQFAVWDTPADSITLNKWQHVAVSYDKSSTANDPIIYINGIPQTLTERQAPSGTAGDESAGNFFIGNRSSDAARAFQGRIDDLRYYNYIRTPKQIIQDINAGLPAGALAAAGHWTMDEAQGTTAQDTTPNNSDLTLSSASWTTSGKFNSAWNGTGSVWLSRSDDTDGRFDFAASDDLSVSFWFKSDSADNPASGTDQYLVTKGTITNTGTVGYTVYADNNGKINLGIRSTSGAWGASSPGTPSPDDTATSTTDIYDNTWHHIVATKTGTSRIDLYVDGRLDASDTSLTATGTLANAISLYVGDDDGDATNSFAGDIDEVKIYRAALNADDVKVEFNQGKGVVFGSLNVNATGTPSNSQASAFCPPGNAETNCAAGSNPSPVGWWKLDEKTGTGNGVVKDSSGYGNNLDMQATMTESDWIPGKIGSALDFDGSNDYATISDGSQNGLDVTGPLTIEAWTYVRTTGSTIAFAGKSGATGQQGYFLRRSSGNIFTLVLSGDGTAATNFNGTTTVATNTWYHVAGVYDGSYAYLYVNGKSDMTPTAYSSGLYNNTAPFNIGARNNNTQYWDGLIDDVRIYNYARTPAQIAWDYNRGAPVGWWVFDECSGVTAYDNSRAANGAAGGKNGTITPGDTSGDNDSAGTCGSGTTTEMWNDGTTGKRNASLGFDGTNDYVSIADDTNLRFDAATADFSLFAWVKRAATGANHTVIAKEEADNDGWRLLLTSSNTVQCSVDAVDVSSTSTITDSNWHHVGCTIDRDGNGQIYLDGKPDGTATAISSEAMATTSTIRIGTNSIATPTNYFSGQIDDVRVYNYALSTQQVKLLYNDDAAVRFGPETGSP